MHLRSLSLRNYRVYRELDLEFPDGLVGIYGPNGSGKSTLIESIRYALYGDSRTDKAELRSAGVREDLRVELVFEHEGNTYDVRRRLKGLNLTPEVEVYRNGQLAVQSVREANAFVGRVLGMDQRAFLASVCAQQKELTAFTGMVPSERRRLVLDLLGVSPVERALAKVREEARGARDRAGGARGRQGRGRTARGPRGRRRRARPRDRGGRDLGRRAGRRGRAPGGAGAGARGPRRAPGPRPRPRRRRQAGAGRQRRARPRQAGRGRDRGAGRGEGGGRGRRRDAGR